MVRHRTEPWAQHGLEIGQSQHLTGHHSRMHRVAINATMAHTPIHFLGQQQIAQLGRAIAHVGSHVLVVDAFQGQRHSLHRRRTVRARGQMHHATSGTSTEQRQQLLSQQEMAQVVHLKRGFHAIHCEVVGKLRGNTGIVHQNVQRWKRRQFLRHCGGLLQIRQVQLHGILPEVSTTLRDIATADQDAGIGTGQLHGHFAAQTCGGSGDKGHLPSKVDLLHLSPLKAFGAPPVQQRHAASAVPQHVAADDDHSKGQSRRSTQPW
mmetsp:Transcript_11131/g.24473  ORF Transcript_11131/g.24473 Transcript_11131/m.24473 type:complete len:264 (-) Transcript_11131:32-823(-)